MVNPILIIILIAAVAFLYSSVGHGGASGYLALMAMFNFNPVEMRSSALLLNILVSGIAFYQFYRSGNFRWRIFFPFIILSIPLAFAGAHIHPDIKIYKILLGIFLAVAALRISGIFQKNISNEKSPIKIFPAVIIGGIIGFFSGLIGIGGGILLSPILIFFRWADLKETSAVSALFIFVNSITGYLGVIQGAVHISHEIIFWICAAFTGGISGAYYGSRIMNRAALRYLLSAVLIFASIKLIII